LQHPINRSKPAKPPAFAPENTTAAASSRHELTEEQIRTIKPVIEQISQGQAFLSFFLNHVVRERKLDQIPGGYTLTEDGSALVAAQPRQ